MNRETFHDEPTIQLLVAMFQIEELVARIRLRVREAEVATRTGGADWMTARSSVSVRDRLAELAERLDR